MGKALGTIFKIGAVIAGIALAIPSGGTSLLAATLGVSGAVATGIAMSLAIGSSLLAPKPKAPATSPEDRNRLLASIDPRTPRKIWLGDTAAPTDIQDQEFTGTQEFLHRFVVCASHKASQFREVWFDDKLAWTSGGGAQGEFAGYLTITPILEGTPGNAINISPRMGSTRRYTGCAYLHIRYKLTGTSKKSESPFAQAIPSRVTIRGKGAPVYDVRLDSTAGGSGPQRADDQTTWTWNDDAARNPALQLLWYLLGWRIQNPVTSAWKLAVGKGIPADRIDLESFITAANLCDELVSKSSGGTEPRYRSDGVFSEDDDPTLVLDNLKAAMNAVLDDVDGKIRITVLHNDLSTPQAALTTDDVLGEFKWSQTQPLTSSFNVIRGSYTDPSDASLYQSIDYPEVRIDSPDGIDRIETINLPLVQSASQAQRIVKQRLQRQQYGGMFQAVFQATAWRYLKGDVVPFTFAPLGWTNKLFRIVDIEVRVDGTVPMTLREENADIYQWDASDAPPVAGADPTTYDYTLNPIYQDLQDITAAITGYLTNESHTLPADASGNVTSYAGATGQFVVFFGSVDVSDQFTLGTAPGGNPEALAVNYVDQTYTVTGGLGASEDSATLSIRATGTGAFTGVVLDKVFSLSKSKAGVGGVSPPLIVVSATHQTFGYDSSGAPKTQTTTVSATRQNTSGTTEWRVLEADGTPITGFATAAATVSAGAATSAPDNDTLTLSSALFQSLTVAFATPGVIYEARINTATAIMDRVSMVKVQDGANGATGPSGINSATITIFKRSPTAPALPTVSTTYTFATATLTGLDNGWTTTIPAGTDPLYASAATAATNTATDTIAAGEWASPVILAQNGATGASGLNVASVFIYQRAASAPSVPSATVTYTFATGALTGLNNGWSATVPSGSDPLYVSTATAASTTATDAIATGEWASPTIMAVNGASGLVGLLTNESHTVPADSSGNVTSYSGAGGSFKVYSGTADVTASFGFTIPPGGNPQGLSVPGGPFATGDYSVTGGFDAGESAATLTMRATGSGAYAGAVVDKVFSLSKSIAGGAGANGVSPPLIYVTSTHQTFTYNSAGVVTPQTTTINAVRQNTAAATLWVLRKADGTVILTARSAAAIVAAGGASTAPDNDTLTLTHTQFNALLDASSTTGVIYEAYPTGLVTIADRISIVKVQDGATGSAGADGIAPILSKAAVLLDAYADGTLKSGALTNATGTLKLRRGTTDLTVGVTYSAQGSTPAGITATIDSSGNWAITGCTIDSGAFMFRATYSGANYDIDVSVTKARQGSAAFSKDGLVSNITSSNVYADSGTISGMPSSEGAGIQLTSSIGYTVPSGSAVVVAKGQYRINGGAWTDFSGSEQTGTTATAGDPGQVDISGYLAAGSIPAGAVIDVKVLTRKSVNGGVTVTIDGTMQAAWA